MVTPDPIIPQIVEPERIAPATTLPDAVQPHEVAPLPIAPAPIIPGLIMPDSIPSDVIAPDRINPAVIAPEPLVPDAIAPHAITPQLVEPATVTPLRPALTALLITLTALFATEAPAQESDPLQPWRSGVQIRPVLPASAERHSIHSYFNTCPESPDGTQVLFYSSTALDGHKGEVHIINRKTGEERTLVTNIEAEDAHRAACQQWLSGGKRISFHGLRDGTWFVGAVDLDTGKERVLAKNRLSSWGQPHADLVPIYGQHWDPGEHTNLELCNAATGEIKTVLTAEAVRQQYPDWVNGAFAGKPFIIFFPVLSPGLDRVFFKLAAPGITRDPRGGGASQRLGLVCYSLSENRFLYQSNRWGHPSWHPDKKTIVETSFFLYDSDNGKYRRLPDLPPVRGDHPSASPDGKLIVTDTTMDKFGGSEKEWGIVLADARGSRHVLLHHFKNDAGARSWRRSHPHPVFSADGRRIYFNVSDGKWTRLFVAECAPSSADPFKDKRAELAASVAVSPLAKKTAPRKTDIAPDAEPVALAKDVPAAEVDGKSYDVIVIGATASGVASAVRASREGCTVLLVQHNRHIGGMMSNGLMQWDALYGGPRAPLFTELLGNIEKHYIERFGKDSPDHQTARYTHEHYPIGWAEPHVNEREFNRLVAGEKNITLLLDHYPVAAPRDGALIKGVTLRAYGTTKDIRATASVFIDATYEGDLLALAKVPFRVGREARDEYDEPHAGKVFVNMDKGSAPAEAHEAKLNIRPYNSRQGSVDPTSPFTADGAVQAYNYRFCVTKDPANRIMLTEPPPGYNREEYLTFDRKSIATNPGPNLKSHMNSPILPGENHAYPEADWPTREKIIERHKNFGLGLIWFLQNDESIAEKARAGFREWGLPRDEFTDHGHIPYEMYVREARRLVGRHVLTELDGMLAKEYRRTPIQPDSIATTDWYQDSHSCTKDSRPGFRYDGKLILTEESRPAQIPYRSLLPQGVDNLLVPVCLSATHVMWGAIRLEPVWMQTGEAAGFAAAQSIKDKKTPATIDSDKLVRTLVENQFLVSFFNDVKVTREDSWNAAVQYFGTKGFFADYDARPADLLDKATAEAWVETFAKLTGDNGAKVAPALAAKLAGAAPAAGTVSVQAFLKLVESRSIKSSSANFQDTKPAQPGVNERPVKRGEACEILYGPLRVVHGISR